jgi:hypothetical protein
MTDQEGRYRFDDLVPGTFTVRATKGGYETASREVSAANSLVNVNFTLKPVFRILTETITGSVSGGDPPCLDGLFDDPCKKHSFNIHHDGTIRARVTWSGGADVDLELWLDGREIADSRGVRSSEEVEATARPGVYQVRVTYYSGSRIANYTLVVTRPN